MRSLLIVLILAIFAFGKTENWNGVNVSAITDTLDSNTVYYSGAFTMSDLENMKVYIMVDDTGTAGFSGDSINFEWGIQTGSLKRDSTTAFTLDTLWQEIDRFVVDTCVVDSFGIGYPGSIDPDGTVNRVWGMSTDTSDVTGYAIQSRQISPEWDLLIRGYVKSLGGINRDGASLKLYWGIDQRVYQPVRRK